MIFTKGRMLDSHRLMLRSQCTVDLPLARIARLWREPLKRR